MYREWAPPAALAGAVACVWSHAGGAITEGERRVLPDNCADILLELGPDGEVLDASVVGTMTRALMVPSGGPRMLGLRFRPGWLPALLDVPGRELRDARIALADLGWRGVAALAPRAGDPTALLRLGGRLVETRRHPPPAVRAAIDAMERTQGAVRVGPLCRDLGISRQHLARLFDEAVGIPPKLAGRVVRMQHVVAAAPRVAPGGWARLAMEHGYADQSHLVSDLRELTGTTPTGLA